MTAKKQFRALALALVLVVSLSLPVHAVEPAGDSFASFLIDADATDFPEQTLQVDLYRRNSSGSFASDDSVRYSCQLNRAAGQANFYIQPKADGVWAEVDYLTDMNGDGIYEMLDGESAPVCDSITPAGDLIPWSGTDYTLNNGQTYILSAQTLRQRGEEVLRVRSSGGSQFLGLGTSVPDVDSLLYFITLHYISPITQEEYALSYYLRIFDQVIVPSDVPPSAWYYGAVEYVLAQGLFSGTGTDSFAPNESATRSMLWVVLANLENQTLSGGEFWYSAAQNWAIQRGISDGSDPNGSITREQLALMLYNLAGSPPPDETDHLSVFTDQEDVSLWAEQGVNWAVSQGLLSGSGNGILNPKGTATRAELAAVLRQYAQLESRI